MVKEETVSREIYVCEVCDKKFRSEVEARMCEVSPLKDFTGGMVVGSIIRTNGLGLECGYGDWLGMVLATQVRGHEKGILFRDYRSGEDIYAGEDLYEYWSEVDKDEREVWREIYTNKDNDDKPR